MNNLQEANKIYQQNFPNQVNFGRCIFLSWYCDIGTCNFCFRSTTKHKIKHAKNARRSIPSILTDAIISKNLNWNLEFLTGGYRIFPFDEILEITKLVSQIYNKKIWINLGTLTNEQLNQLKPYTEGICASIETINPTLHNKICPDKPIKPYEDLLKRAKDFKKSITIVIGLGETEDDKKLLFDFIRKHNLNRITFYALKPIKGTPYKESPSPDYYASWIAQTRINFPNLEIIAGLTPKSAEHYVKLLIDAGANTITKFPAIRRFNSNQSKIIEEEIKKTNRKFTSTLTKLPDINWNKEIEKLNINKDTKQKVKLKLNQYINKMR